MDGMEKMIPENRDESTFLRAWTGIALLSVCGFQGDAETVVDFKSDSHENHLVFDIEFANLDGEGNHELVLIENGYNGSLHVAVSISHVSEDSRKVLWRGKRLVDAVYKILVGNIDNDRQDEVIVHRSEDAMYDLDSPATLRVIQFENDQFQEVLYTTLAGEYGALIDIDNDQKSEVVLITDAIPDFGGHETRVPSRIRLYSFDDDQFNQIAEFDVENTIQCIATGDVDGVGHPEIVAQEASNDGKIRHQISVYDVASDGEISHLYSKNKVLTLSRFSTRLRDMHVFTDSSSNTFVSAYNRRRPRSEFARWNTDNKPLRGDDMLLRVYNANGIKDIREIEADFELRTEAVRHRLPTDGKYYDLIEDRQPRLTLYQTAELGEVVRKNDRR